MIIQANLNEAVRSLHSAKQRTLLALIGIVIGIASVIAMVTVGNIVQLEALRQFKELGTDILSVEKDFGSGDEGSRGAQAVLRGADVAALVQDARSAQAVSAYAQVSAGEATFRGRKLERTNVLGVTESFLAMNKLTLQSGRFLSDLDEQARYVVLGADLAAEMQKNGVTQVVGESIRLGDTRYTVVGVLAPVAQSGMRRFEPNVLVMLPLTTALRLPGSEISVINVRVRAGFSNAAAMREIQSIFQRRVRAPAVRITSPEELIRQMEKQMQMFTLLLGTIGSISLVVGGVGVMNVMLVSVTERRREIGVRRALGARRADIRQQFLIESIILSLLGGVIGIVIGVGAARVISHFAHWQFEWSPLAVLLGFVVSSAVGVFFGFYPARQASQLDPIVALRSD